MPKFRRCNFLSQNCRGLKKDIDLVPLADTLRRRNVFAAALQETWRCNDERLVVDSAAFLFSGRGTSFDFEDSRYADGCASLWACPEIMRRELPLPAPGHTYSDKDSWDDVDITPVAIDHDRYIPFVHQSKYLGSVIHQSLDDEVDVDSRVSALHLKLSALYRSLFSADVKFR